MNVTTLFMGRSFLPLFAVLLVSGGIAVYAESETKLLGFSSTRSVEGMLAETAERQREGSLAKFRAHKEALESSSGLTYGFDNQIQYLGTDADKSPSDAATNVFRIYGTWTVTSRGTPDNGALVFKIENRSAVGDNISTQALGPALGYAGVLSSTYSDAGSILTNFYWRQRFADGRGSFVIGRSGLRLR